MANNEFFEALSLLAKEKGLDPDQLVEKIKTAITIAIKKDYPGNENIEYDIDLSTGKFNVSILKEIVEEVENGAAQITLDAAQKYSKRYKLGDMCAIKLDTRQFGRIAAQTAKQVMRQGFKEVEKDQLLEQWGGLQNEAITAKVLRIMPGSGDVALEINGAEIMLLRSDMLPTDEPQPDDMLRVYVSGVSRNDKHPTLRVSRTHKDFIKRLFESEVPEIHDGTVEIRAVSREPGFRSKIAVISNNPNVDPVGTCIGPGRSRVTHVCQEIGGEKIDIVNFSEDIKEFIKQSLKPAEVLEVEIPDEAIRACSVTVPDNQLSLAIGNKGQNAKLAARLTGFKIDIKPESGFFEG